VAPLSAAIQVWTGEATPPEGGAFPGYSDYARDHRQKRRHHNAAPERISGDQADREQVIRIRLFLAWFAFCSTAQASSSYRVGNELLTAGDSAVRVIELLGKPSYKSHHSGSRSSHRNGSQSGAHRSSSRSSGRGHGADVVTKDAPGEQWQYRRDDRVITVTIVDGKVSDIDDRRR
jgi:hypothetical protein